MSMRCAATKWFPGPEKAKGIAFHPRLPWLATWDGAETCTVWDYERGTVVFTLNATRLATRLGISSIGNVKAAFFCDNDVLLSIRHIFPEDDGQYFSDQLPDGVQLSRYLHNRRVCVICCQFGIVVHDIPSRSTVFIPRPVESKKVQPTKAVLAFPDFGDVRGAIPFIVVATDKGTAEVYDTTSRELVGLLTGGPKCQMNCLLVTNSSGTSVVAGFSDGSLIVWEMARQDLTQPHMRIQQAHKGSISELFMIPLKKLFVSLGTDKMIHLWNATSNVRLASYSIPLKDPYLTAVVAFTGYQNADLIIPSVSMNAFMKLDLQTGAFNILLSFPDVSQQLSTKDIKIFAAATSPGDWRRLAIGTSSGTMTTFLQPPASSAMPFCALIPAPSVDPIVVFAKDGCICCLQYAATEQDDETKRVVMREQEAAPIPAHLLNDTPSVAVSGDSTFVSVFWEKSREFRVYKISARGTWPEVDRGEAISFCWHQWKAVYCTLVPQSLSVSATVQDPTDLPGIEQDKSLDDTEGTRVAKIYEIFDSGTSSRLVKEHLLPDIIAEAVVSGPLLCVTYIKGGEDITEKLLRFHSWETLESINEIEHPNWIAWGGHEFAAFGYPDCVAIFSIRPQFQCKSIVDLSNCVGGMWQRNLLCLSTPREIKMVFVGMMEGGETDYLEVITVASMCAQLSLDKADKTLPLPHKKLKPFGTLRVLGIKNTDLWMIDSHCRAYAFNMSHPGVHARILASQGDIISVEPVLERLFYEYHDQISNLLVALNVENVVSLVSGTSQVARFYQCLDHEDFQSALGFIEDMLLPKEFEKETAPDPLLVLPAASTRKQSHKNVDIMLDLSTTAPQEEEGKQLALKREFLSGVTRTQRFCQTWVEPLQDLKDLAIKTGNRNALQRILQIFQMAGNHVPENPGSLALGQRNLRNIASMYRRLESSGVLAAAMSGNPEIIQRALNRENNFACAGLLASAQNQLDASYFINAWNNKLRGVTVFPRQG